VRPATRGDGTATHLFPLAETERAKRIVSLVGGVPQTLLRGREALAKRDFQWAAELADCILAEDGANVEAKRLKALALMELGERQTSANARNYDLSVAQHLLRGVPPQ
jgi:alkyl sulfatase BDS1-like metallo-beta-lactamase superfamily hydrolase